MEDSLGDNSSSSSITRTLLCFTVVGFALYFAFSSCLFIWNIIDIDFLHYNAHRSQSHALNLMVESPILGFVAALLNTELSLIVGAITAAISYEFWRRVPFYSVAVMFPLCCWAMYIQTSFLSFDHSWAFPLPFNINIWRMSAIAVIQVPILIGCWLYSNSIFRPFTRVITIFAVFITVNLFANMLGALGITPDRVLFEYNKSSYLKQVSEIQQTNGAPLMKFWLWREIASFPAGGTFYWLFYDDSDQIILPPQSRTVDWKRRFQEVTHYEFGSGDSDWNGYRNIKRLDNHFYLITVST